MSTIISMVGRAKSGKSTLGAKLARYLRTAHIETSDIVRSLYKDLSLEELAATSKRTRKDPDWLSKEIVKVIEDKLDIKKRTVVIVSGIREIEIVTYLKTRYDYYGFEVKADTPVRFNRSIDDGKYTTADQFIRGEIRELEMGLEEVEDDAPFAIPTSPLTNPDRIVRATVKLLRSRGATLR